jgi:hypothetical protein
MEFKSLRGPTWVPRIAFDDQPGFKPEILPLAGSTCQMQHGLDLTVSVARSEARNPLCPAIINC